MNEGMLLGAALAAGFFGSTHCIGMCGAVVVLLESDGPGGAGGPRRLAYNAGRLGFYVLLGTLAAVAGGLAVGRIDGALVVLRVFAGAVVLALGIQLATGLRPLAFLERPGALLWKRLGPLARHLLPAVTVPRALAAGFLWGALPCGLVYSAVALAATSGDAATGAAVMAVFWAGTLPALLAVGAGAERLSAWRRQPGKRRAAGVLLAAAGAFAIALPFAHAPGGGQDGHAEHRPGPASAALR